MLAQMCFHFPGTGAVRLSAANDTHVPLQKKKTCHLNVGELLQRFCDLLRLTYLLCTQGRLTAIDALAVAL